MQNSRHMDRSKAAVKRLTLASLALTMALTRAPFLRRARTISDPKSSRSSHHGRYSWSQNFACLVILLFGS
jgi:hypothetical protein